jgi:hypothetical protein
MLLPDNVHPELCIYYNSSLLLKSLQQKSNQNMLDLFQDVKINSEMTFPIFVLSLDWLYLIDLAKLNKNGEIQLCT